MIGVILTGNQIARSFVIGAVLIVVVDDRPRWQGFPHGLLDDKNVLKNITRLVCPGVFWHKHANIRLTRALSRNLASLPGRAILPYLPFVIMAREKLVRLPLDVAAALFGLAGDRGEFSAPTLAIPFRNFHKTPNKNPRLRLGALHTPRASRTPGQSRKRFAKKMIAHCGGPPGKVIQAPSLYLNPPRSASF